MDGNSPEDARDGGDTRDNGGENGGGSNGIGTAASTDYRRHVAEANTVRLTAADTAHPAAGKSLRVHSRAQRSSLAARLSMPIIVCIVLASLVICLVARSEVQGMLLEDLRTDAANVAYMGSMFGRRLIDQHNRFLRDNPDYLEKAEFRAGDHWLVRQGFVSGRDWEEATGFQPDDLAPVSLMFQAGRKAALADLGHFLNSPASGTEIVGLFILNADGALIASCRKDTFPLDEDALRDIPQTAGRYEAGAAAISIDYIETFEPEPVMRGIARIFSEDGAKTHIGDVVSVMRTERHFSRLNGFLLLLAGLMLLLVLALAAVCRLSARRVVSPLRRLAADMQAIAEGDYSRRSAIRENDETGMAAQAFNSMAERLRLARLNEQETSRLESDLAIARGIQNNLLPQQTPRVRGLDIHTAYRPAKEIGGDYFDFLPVDGEHMGLVVADASGKSIPAALVMSTTRAILRFVAPGGQSAAETLTQTNAILSADIPRGMFVTAYYVILDPLQNSMLCASAGHNPLLIARRDGSVELMNPGGIALGFDSGSIFQRSIREQRVRLESGDRVLLYTDGVVECVNPANEEYSDRRLREFLRRNRDLSSHDFVGALMADLDRHRGPAEMKDDTTIVTFKMM